MGLILFIFNDLMPPNQQQNMTKVQKSRELKRLETGNLGSKKLPIDITNTTARLRNGKKYRKLSAAETVLEVFYQIEEENGEIITFV